VDNTGSVSKEYVDNTGSVSNAVHGLHFEFNGGEVSRLHAQFTFELPTANAPGLNSRVCCVIEFETVFVIAK